MPPTGNDLKLVFIALKSHYKVCQQSFHAKAENFLSKLVSAHQSNAPDFELRMTAREVLRSRNFIKAAKYLEVLCDFLSNNAYLFEAREPSKELLDALQSFKCTHIIFGGKQYQEMTTVVEKRYKKEWKLIPDQLTDLTNIDLIKLCQTTIDDETIQLFLEEMWPERSEEEGENAVETASGDMQDLLERINNI